MPLYEFHCQDCGVFEVWRSMSESQHPAFCPKCQQAGKRIFSVAAVNLSSGLPRREVVQHPRAFSNKTADARGCWVKKCRLPSHNCGRPSAGAAI